MQYPTWQDAEIPGLKAKNTPLVPYQPVVTTVLYECPDQDASKEMVVWRPLLNWESGASFEGPLATSARAITTPHGCVHIQRSGIQRTTKHGVFHSPGAPAREGWRVALTARVAHPDAADRVNVFVQEKVYCCEFGPDGRWTLPESNSGE